MLLQLGLGGYLVGMNLRIDRRSLGSWSGSGGGSCGCLGFIEWRVYGNKGQ